MKKNMYFGLLLEIVYDKVKKPLIVSGGFGSLNDVKKIKKYPDISLSITSALHYNKVSLKEINNIK